MEHRTNNHPNYIIHHSAAHSNQSTLSIITILAFANIGIPDNYP
jgi:hypothetical protein